MANNGLRCLVLCLAYFISCGKVQITFLFCTWGRSSVLGPSVHPSRAQDGSIYHTFHTEPTRARPCRHRRLSFGKSRNRNRSTYYLWSFYDRVHKCLPPIYSAISFFSNGLAVQDQERVKKRKIKSCSIELSSVVANFRITGNSN